MSQDATERGARNAVLNSRLRDFQGYRLAADCGTPECGGERTYNIFDIARLHGEDVLIERAISRLRCRACDEAPKLCFLETGPELASRGRMRRLSLIGPENRGDGR